jgi:hypothetical protein
MSGCADVTLLHAFDVWWGGAKLDGYCIHGINTVALGRFAKLLALISSIPLIIDIVGEDRIHAASRELSGFLVHIFVVMTRRFRNLTRNFTGQSLVELLRDRWVRSVANSIIFVFLLGALVIFVVTWWHEGGIPPVNYFLAE